jgi:hypothetical protein
MLYNYFWLTPIPLLISSLLKLCVSENFLLLCLKFLNCKRINLYCWRQLLYERISLFLPFDMNYKYYISLRKKILNSLKLQNCKCINLYCWRQLLYERISQFLPFDMNYETSFPLEEICYIIWLQMLALYIFCRVQSITSTTLVFMNLSNFKSMFKLVWNCSKLFKIVQTCSNLIKLVQTCSNLYVIPSWYLVF